MRFNKIFSLSVCAFSLCMGAISQTQGTGMLDETSSMQMRQASYAAMGPYTTWKQIPVDGGVPRAIYTPFDHINTSTTPLKPDAHSDDRKPMTFSLREYALTVKDREEFEAAFAVERAEGERSAKIEIARN